MFVTLEISDEQEQYQARLMNTYMDHNPPELTLRRMKHNVMKQISLETIKITNLPSAKFTEKG